MGRQDTGTFANRWIARRAGPALVVSAMVLCAACRGPSAAAAAVPASAPPPAGAAGAQAAPRRQILNALPAPPYAYELSLENCAVPVRENPKDETACTFAVHLLE